MNIAKSNVHSSGYLDINSEVLLLAFEPEAREVIREELKGDNQEESNKIIRALKESLEEEKERVQNWRAQAALNLLLRHLAQKKYPRVAYAHLPKFQTILRNPNG
jgi:hypothetical protein